MSVLFGLQPRPALNRLLGLLHGYAVYLDPRAWLVPCTGRCVSGNVHTIKCGGRADSGTGETPPSRCAAHRRDASAVW